MSADEQRKLAAIMFTDMVGYSALSQRDEKLAQELLEEHRRLLREIFPRFNGTEIKTIGDAFLVEFGSALEAAQCAIEIQRTLAKRNADIAPDRRIELKIGVHIGDVVHRGGDVYGDGVNIASRIEPVAGPGGICVSMDVERQIRNALEARFEKLATTELKNISVPMDLFRIVLPWERNARLRDERQKPGVRLQRSIPIGWVVAAVLLLVVIGAGVFIFQRQKTKVAPRQSEAATASTIPEKSIAVLPFENRSEEKQNEYFAEGVQDEILTNLARVADLKVISRTSVIGYRDTAGRNLRKIGEELGVAHVLEGSVQRASGKVRVNAQLIDARNDAHLWAQTYDRDLADVFAIQSEIAKTIADQLQARLSPKEQAMMETKPTKDMAAYDLYLRASEIERNRASSIGTGGAEGAKKEIELLNQAVARDPGFVPALCKLAITHLYLHWLNDHAEPHVGLAKNAIEAAARLQPDASEVHLAQAILHYRGSLDYEPALAELALAQRGMPNDASIPFLIGMINRRQGKWEESIHHNEHAVALDPRNIPFISELATTYFILRRYEDAARTLDGASASTPNNFTIEFLHAVVDLAWKADLARWRAVVVGSATAGDPNDVISARVALGLMERNYRAAEEALATPGRADFDDNGFFIPREWIEGIIARARGDRAKANAAFLAARHRAAAAVAQRPDDARALIVLGQIDATLGRKEDAIREGERATQLLPISKDALIGAILVERLARIYAQVADTNRALDFLENATKRPIGPTYGSLKLEEDWDRLRGDPRFEKIVASLAPK
jgi:adenylate cyclase